ncbi:condensation domain-containing protein [Streptomyces roseifaciens]|uniref:condensation domain-containing protein n=1 Tax=Streptomyces roseifaciens TaxID=1488406 RepID=UPI000717E7CD|nr:condensation domain-containing protein [Streptomyces roseifaciens]
MTVRRRLSPYERVVWAAGEALPATVVAAVHVEGTTTPARLRRALAAVRDRHPLVGARVERTGPWRAWLTTRDVPETPLRVVGAGSGRPLTRVMEEELQRPFTPGTGPLARFVLVDGGTSFDLLAAFHHVVADGHSAAIVIRDILEHLAAPAAEQPVVAAPSADGLLPGPRVRPSDLVKLSRSLRIPGQATGPARACGPATPLTCHTWTMGKAETAALLERCRAERTTVHGALCTAFARARRASGPARIAVAADLRRILVPAPQESVGLYAASFVLPVDPGLQDGFWNRARDVKERLHRRLNPEELRPLVAGFRLMPLPHRMITALLHRSEKKGARFDVALSNVRMSIPDTYGDLRVTAFHGVAHTTLSGAPVVILIGLGGRLFLSVTSTDPDAAGLCERAMAHLRAAAAPTATGTLALARPET